MTKADIVKKLHEKIGVEKDAAQVIVEEFMSVVKESLTSGENVYLRGFGTFEVVRREEKTGQNITKGTSITIPAHYTPKFKPCKEFKDMLK